MSLEAALLERQGRGEVTSPLIRDDDLLKRLADAPPMFRGTIADSCHREQLRRDALATLPDGQRRRAEIARRLADDAGVQREDLRHIHSVLAICSLPYQRPAGNARTWERKQGRMSLVVNAGSLASPNGEWIEQPLPYGSRARLLLLHTCNEAIRQKSSVIEIENSLTGFIKSMGFPVTGGKNGTLNSFKQQIQALAACTMKIGVWDGARAKTVNTQPFSAIDVWFPKDPNQPRLWSSTLTFSQDFYQTLTRHALPVNFYAVRAFANSPRKLDLYWWLAYRLHGLDKPLTISWDALKDQWGQGYVRDRRFRSDFAEEISQIKEVFPKLPVKLTETGFVISPGAMEVLAIPNHRK